MELAVLSESSVQFLTPGGLPAGEVEGLYIHIPFCFHKCHYCDFYSITRQTEDRMSRFVDLILDEATLWTANPACPLPRPRTVFFGGGTPSLLPVPHMRRLILGLQEQFEFDRLEEWRIECN